MFGVGVPKNNIMSELSRVRRRPRVESILGFLKGPGLHHMRNNNYYVGVDLDFL